jgi:Flp pilus assembly pilin Flp
MIDRITIIMGRLLTVSRDDLRREDGQGATEYAMVIGFVIVGLTITLGLLGTGIENFLTRVASKLDGLLPSS